MIASSQVSVSNSATLIYSATVEVEVRLLLTSGNIYYGGDNTVSTTTGYYHPGNSTEVKLSLLPGDKVYGISVNANTYVVNVLALSQES